MKKVLLGLVLGGVLLVGLFFLIVYLLYTPKYKDVSNVSPFVEIVGKELTTMKKALIIENPSIPLSGPYSYHLEDGTGYGLESGLPTIAELPLGTPFVIEKVEFKTGGVSGTTSCVLYGKAYPKIDGKEYAFQYYWGEYRSLYQDEPHWVFGESFWLNQPLKEKYVIEVP